MLTQTFTANVITRKFPTQNRNDGTVSGTYRVNIFY